MNDTIYVPAYSRSQEARLARLHESTREYFAAVLSVLQKVEDIGGPEGLEYLRLMEAVIEEAAERRDYYRDHTLP